MTVLTKSATANSAGEFDDKREELHLLPLFMGVLATMGAGGRVREVAAAASILHYSIVNRLVTS